MDPLTRTDWPLVPLRFRTQLAEYVAFGRPPISPGLLAVLTNDLSGAVENMAPAEIADLVTFLQRHVPAIAWGTGEKIARWEAVGGYEGEFVH